MVEMMPFLVIHRAVVFEYRGIVPFGVQSFSKGTQAVKVMEDDQPHNVFVLILFQRHVLCGLVELGCLVFGQTNVISICFED